MLTAKLLDRREGGEAFFVIQAKEGFYELTWKPPGVASFISMAVIIMSFRLTSYY